LRNEDGKYRSFLGNWWNHINRDRWGSVPRREVWNSVGAIAWGYSDRREEWLVLFSAGDFDFGFTSAHYYIECDCQIFEKVIQEQMELAQIVRDIADILKNFDSENQFTKNFHQTSTTTFRNPPLRRPTYT
jgi:hypothetical protein